MMRIVLGNQTRWTTTRYDLVVRGVLTEICRHIRDVVPQQKWRWIRNHISLARYMGGTRDGGLRKLREELEAENGVHIPAEIRWLGGAKVRARFQASRNGSSSVVAAVLGEATFGRLCKAGVRFLGRRYEVDAFEEAGRPDAFCSRCSAWKHIAPHCLALWFEKNVAKTHLKMCLFDTFIYVVKTHSISVSLPHL